MRWWRLFKFKRGRGDAPDDSAQGPRRRDATRYDYRTDLRVKCDSWPQFAELISGDVSATGIFVATESDASVGESVVIAVSLPDGHALELQGKVARRVGSGEGRHGAGLGIQLEEMAAPEQSAFDELVERARNAMPHPEDVVADDPADLLELDDSELEELDDSELLVFDEDELPAMEPVQAPHPPAPSPPLPPAATATSKGSRAGGPIVGIDLGTTYTSVAAVVGSKVLILPREDGRKSTPSVISFPDNETIVIGDRDRIATDPAHTVVSPKRILGRPFNEPEVERFTGQAPYRTVEGPDGSVLIEMWGDYFAVPQLVSYLLDDARSLAESHIGERVERAVVSVPISFDADRVAFLRRAGQMAGLDIVAVIDEPSAAALANRFDPNFGGIVGVYDFGGGTFDFSIVDVSHGDFRVLATSGDTWLGGDDFDNVLATAAANQFWRKHQVDLRNQAMEWQRLLFACEHAKRQLTKSERAAIHVPEVLRTAEGMVDLHLTIDRDTLDRASMPIIEQSLDTCNEALELIGMEPSQLTAVYLSGGTTYIPSVRKALASHFGIPIRTGVPPEHAVCLGAAIHAAQMQFNSDATLESRED